VLHIYIYDISRLRVNEMTVLDSEKFRLVSRIHVTCITTLRKPMLPLLQYRLKSFEFETEGHIFFAFAHPCELQWEMFRNN